MCTRTHKNNSGGQSWPCTIKYGPWARPCCGYIYLVCLREREREPERWTTKLKCAVRLVGSWVSFSYYWPCTLKYGPWARTSCGYVYLPWLRKREMDHKTQNVRSGWLVRWFASRIIDYGSFFLRSDRKNEISCESKWSLMSLKMCLSLVCFRNEL